MAKSRRYQPWSGLVLSPVLYDLVTVWPRVGKSLKPQIPHVNNGNGHSTYSLYVVGVIKAG